MSDNPNRSHYIDLEADIALSDASEHIECCDTGCVDSIDPNDPAIARRIALIRIAICAAHTHNSNDAAYVRHLASWLNLYANDGLITHDELHSIVSVFG